MPRSSSGEAAADVLRVGDRLEVVWVTAGAVSAGVIEFEFRRHGEAVGEEVGDPVGVATEAGAAVETGVAEGVEWPAPGPAGGGSGGGVNEGVKGRDERVREGGDGLSVDGHGETIHQAPEFNNRTFKNVSRLLTGGWWRW